MEASGIPVTRNTHAGGGDFPLGVLRYGQGAVAGENRLQYPLRDHLGSVVALLDGTGGMGGQADYAPYGRAFASNDLSEGLARYGGLGTDPESETVFARNRYYDPFVGLFAEPDPIGHLGGWNQYAYAMGNPVQFQDPYGLQSWPRLGYNGPFGQTQFPSPARVTAPWIRKTAARLSVLNLAAETLDYLLCPTDKKFANILVSQIEFLAALYTEHGLLAPLVASIGSFRAGYNGESFMSKASFVRMGVIGLTFLGGAGVAVTTIATVPAVIMVGAAASGGVVVNAAAHVVGAYVHETVHLISQYGGLSRVAADMWNMIRRRPLMGPAQ
jgi:RHS repeat-associated protein